MPERRLRHEPKTQSAIRKFKDAAGNYLWQPTASAGQAATRMSFPVVEAEDMPDIAANVGAVAFDDFRRGYLVVDRTGVRILRAPYSAKPYVLATQRSASAAACRTTTRSSCYAFA